LKQTDDHSSQGELQFIEEGQQFNETLNSINDDIEREERKRGGYGGGSVRSIKEYKDEV
jgi:hypothetical protein